MNPLRQGDLVCLPSEFFLARAVSATESSDRLAFIGLPLLVTSAESSLGLMREKFQLDLVVKTQTKILWWIIYIVRLSRALISSPTLIPTCGFEIPWRVQRLTLVSADSGQTSHERRVVFEARRRSPNKRFWGKPIALVFSRIFHFY